MKTKVHKLSLDEFFINECRLIGIYSDEPDYRMAYLLNSQLSLNLEKAENGVIQSKTKVEFPVFEYTDNDYFREYRLIANQQLISKKYTINEGLFIDYESIIEETVCYIKELSKTKFLLKITADESEEFYQTILGNIRNILQVYTAEFEDLDQISNKNLLKL